LLASATSVHHERGVEPTDRRGSPSDRLDAQTRSGPGDAGTDGRVLRLTVELEAALVRELRATFDDLNLTFFKGALRRPIIELSETTERLGRWCPETRSLELSRHLVMRRSWGIVIEVLKHEMAHQYVHETLGRTDEPPHGPSFRDVCRRLRIDARAAGLPDLAAPDGELDTDDERILTRVQKLLALAESDSVHEAEAAMSAAQRLMLKHNLRGEDVASADGLRSTARHYGFRHLGRATGRVSESERMIAVILNEHFFVEVVWVPTFRPHEGRRGSILEVCGAPPNLEMASYVYDFLMHAGERLWREHCRKLGIRGNRDRRTFIAGVMSGFFAKLNAQRREHKEQGLVWLGDAELRKFYRSRHPYIHRTRHSGHQRNEAHAQGREAGQRLVLHRPVEAGPTGGPRRLLGR
jgi:hypothetical protein